jgi:hypothetical protein
MASANFFKLKFLYNTTPTVAWSVALPNGVDGSGVAVNVLGTKVFVLDTAKLHCFATSQATEPTTANGTALTTATECAGFPVTPGGTFSKSSPWVDSTWNAVYVANTSGTLYRYSLTGTAIWSLALGGGAIHSDPVEIDNIVYIGSDSGKVFRVQDTTNGLPVPTVGASVSSVTLGTGAVYGSAAIDAGLNKIYFAANDTLYEFNISGTTLGTATTR